MAVQASANAGILRVQGSGGKASRAIPGRKYRNEPTVVDGVLFASKKEARRWSELRLLERLGKITGLKRQHRFPLSVGGSLICTYVADFVYFDADQDPAPMVIEDAKGFRTPVFKLKAKLMAALYQPVTEV